jgi:dynein heavy chain 2
MKVRNRELESELEKFSSRYSAMRPKAVTEFNKESASEMSETMRSWRA